MLILFLISLSFCLVQKKNTHKNINSSLVDEILRRKSAACDKNSSVQLSSTELGCVKFVQLSRAVGWEFTRIAKKYGESRKG